MGIGDFCSHLYRGSKKYFVICIFIFWPPQVQGLYDIIMYFKKK